VRVEFLIDPKMANRGAQMLDAMIATCPFEHEVNKAWRGKSDILMVYGTGHPVRRPWWTEHLRRGRIGIGWDLGYWSRETRTMRLTINGDHPPAMIRPEDPARWDSAGIALRNDFKHEGHILVVGMSRKATKIHGMVAWTWELERARHYQKRYIHRNVFFRPKRDTDPLLPGFRTMRGAIEDALRGASLVVCRHSNVAVDACIAGIPVHCEDGAAFALYKNNPNPTPAERLEFLRSLAHWQYRPDEAQQAWTYIRNRLSV
jgi:hypothetical protein